MRANWGLAFLGLIAAAQPGWAADEDRKIDPTFLHRSLPTARGAASDITTSSCHYKPLFGVGDADSPPTSGIARLY